MLASITGLFSDALAYAADASAELGRWIGASTTTREARLVAAGVAAAVAIAVGVVMLIALLLPA